METNEKLQLKNQISFIVYLCSKEITRKYLPLLEKYDLTYTQYVVMMYFWEKETSNVKELGKTLLLDPSTLTPILKKLEKKGYLIRNKSKLDERNLKVTMTKKGKELQKEVSFIPNKMKECAGLSDKEEEQLYKLLYKVLTNIERNEIE